jgi:hypothetical protein
MPLTASEQYDANKKKDQRSRNAILRQQAEHAKIRWWHLGQRDPMARFTLWLVISTIFLVIATVATFVVLNETDRTLKETMIASNRAWIVPRLLKLAAPPQAGQDLDLIFFNGNSGREPARNVGRHDESKSIPIAAIAGATPQTIATKMREAIEMAGFADNCAVAKTVRTNGVIYPGAVDGYSGNMTVDSKWITEPIVNGYGWVIVKGCFVYETMKETHRSEYCFYYNKIMDGFRPIEQRGYFISCPTGNDAD